ncbi:MAG: DUF4097 family beta strand repeat-containing protein [Defluviitaleaceae bacterium]|nr:DUF4097 family beta strand repeat-containing protein [Defluviitaleaceae bacterium]
MNKSEFLSQLSHKLRVLPENEVRDALDYYEGYISDAHDEATAIESLGSPGEVASTILANYLSQKPNNYPTAIDTPPTRKPKIKTAYIALLAIFAVPVGIPLAASAFGLIVGLLAIIFSVVVTSIALLIAGVLSLITVPFALISDFWFGISTLGLGLASLGLGIIVFKVSTKLVGGFSGITQFIKRRGHKPVAAAPMSFSSSEQYSNSNSLQQQPIESHEPIVRRWRSPSLRLAFLLLLLGAALFGLAWANGARGGIIYWQNGRFNITTFNRSSQADETVEMTIDERVGGFHTVNINATHRNVTVLPGSTDRTQYTGTPNVDISMENGILTIGQLTTGTSFSVVHMDFSPGSSRDIRIYLPYWFFQQPNSRLQVRTTTGNIRIEGNFNTVDASSTTGRIQINDNEAIMNTLTLRSTTGNMTVNNIYFVDQLSAQATTGNITVNNIQNPVNSVSLRATTGQIRTENIDAYTLQIQTTTGRIGVSNATWFNLDIRATTGRIGVGNGYAQSAEGSLTQTQISATTGSVSLEMRNNQDDFRFNMTSSTGRLRLNGSRLADRGTIGMGTGVNTIDIRTTTGSIDLDFIR